MRGKKEYSLHACQEEKIETLYRQLRFGGTVDDLIARYIEECPPTADEVKQNYIDILSKQSPYVWRIGYKDEEGLKIGIVQGFDFRGDKNGKGLTLHFIFATSDHSADFMYLHSDNQIRWQKIRELAPPSTKIHSNGRVTDFDQLL